MTAQAPRAGQGTAAPAVAPWAVDLILAVLVTVVLAFLMATTTGGERSPDVAAYLLAVGIGAVLLLRRRLPRTVLVLTALATFAYYTLDYPPIGVAVPLLAALYSAAEAGLLLWSVGTALVVYGVSTAFRIRDGVEPLGTLIGYESVSNLALAAAAVAIGLSVRSRRITAEQAQHIADLTEAQLVRETEAQLRGERARISRELHDSVGHTLSVIALQAGVAGEAVGRDDAVAREAVERIRVVSRGSLTELRSMVRRLRENDEAPEALVSLTALDGLVESARAAGLAVDLDTAGAPDGLSPVVDAAAYRVVQEALTNVLRHAGATRATVSMSVEGETVRVTVTDDGSAGAGVGSGAAAGAVSGSITAPGAGLTGMRERVRLLGGTLRAEPGPAGGFVVEAIMPRRLPS